MGLDDGVEGLERMVCVHRRWRGVRSVERSIECRRWRMVLVMLVGLVGLVLVLGVRRCLRVRWRMLVSR